MELFAEKKCRNTEELEAEEWSIVDLAFLVAVTVNINKINRELGKVTISSLPRCKTMSKVLESSLDAWENQLKLHDLVHFMRLKSQNFCLL
jgi:hypothetical protein